MLQVATLSAHGTLSIMVNGSAYPVVANTGFHQKTFPAGKVLSNQWHIFRKASRQRRVSFSTQQNSAKEPFTSCLDFKHLVFRVKDKESAMIEFFSKELREGFEAARKRQDARKTRLRIQIGGEVYPILRLWDEGLAMDADQLPHLRGLVDVYDGARHLSQCLIVASTVENGQLVCNFKRSTPVTDRPPLDFWRDENAPVAYLPKA